MAKVLRPDKSAYAALGIPIALVIMLWAWIWIAKGPKTKAWQPVVIMTGI